VVELVPRNVADEANHFWLPPLASPEKFFRPVLLAHPPGREGKKNPQAYLFPLSSSLSRELSGGSKNLIRRSGDRRRRRDYSRRWELVCSLLARSASETAEMGWSHGVEVVGSWRTRWDRVEVVADEMEDKQVGAVVWNSECSARPLSIPSFFVRVAWYEMTEEAGAVA
jgi:hypothetical protein